MKIKILIVAFIPLAAVITFSSSARADQTAPSQQGPATSSTEPAHSECDGIYTEEQGNRGYALYAQRCARCHAPDLTGGETAPALNRAEFKSNWSDLSVDDLFERIKVSMPQDNPGSLSRQQTADILAFVLSKGGFPGGKTELAREAEVLKAIRFEANKPETAGDDGCDYITADSEGRRLYIPHGTEVVVLDLDSSAIVGKIVGQKGVHGVAIAREFGNGFIS